MFQNPQFCIETQMDDKVQAALVIRDRYVLYRKFWYQE